MELRARYAVVLVGGIPIPFIISPLDSDWSLPLGSTSPSVKNVVGAGWARWTLGVDMQVTCTGEGMFFTAGNPVYRKSRGEADAELVRQLLSKPVQYVVFNYPEKGVDMPVFIAAHEEHFSGALRYQHSLRKHVRGAGVVNFLASSNLPECSGEVLFARTDFLYRPHLNTSKGVHDANLILQHYRC